MACAARFAATAKAGLGAVGRRLFRCRGLLLPGGHGPLRQSTRVKNDIVRVAGTGAGLNVTRPPRFERDLSGLVQQRTDVTG
jgi:hypothetical protein